jgi:hypothetical protein
MPERPAPLLLVATGGGAGAGVGSYAGVVETGRSLLAAELSGRLGARGAAVLPLPPTAPPHHWGRWYAEAARAGLALARARGAAVDAIGYASAGALALAADGLLDDLLAPLAGEVVANNRFSADAFVVAGDIDLALSSLEACPVDNAAPRILERAGLTARDLSGWAWSRLDVDTPLDLALLRVASRLPGMRSIAPSVLGFLAMATLPGGGALEIPRVEQLGAVIRDREAELVVAGRIPAAVLQALERDTACRVRAFVEERGMRSAEGGVPRSLLASLMAQRGPAGLVSELAALGDAVVLDTRVLMAAVAGSSESVAWPPAEERFASDFLEAARVTTPWLAELTAAAAASAVPVLLGGHALVSDGLRILVDAAWLGHTASPAAPSPGR